MEFSDSLSIQKPQIDIGISDPASLQKIGPKKSTYFEKRFFQPIFTIEDKFMDSNPWKIVEKVFPKEWHFLPRDPLKTNIFYEFILVVTDSVAIKHYKKTRLILQS